MQRSFWQQAKRQWRLALVRARRAAAPAQSPEAILYVSPYRLCERLHVPGCKFLHTQENVTPDFELFDLTRTTAPTASRNQHTDHIGVPIPPVADAAQMFRKKTKFCAFVFSNPYCATRNRFLEILARHHRIDSAGRAFLNLPQVPQPNFRVIKFFRPYKFVLAFENTLGTHYASEKLRYALNARTVPIYWGCSQIANYFNPERFINAFDFDNLESLAAHVMRVHADDELYLRYLSQPIRTPRQEAKRWKEPPKNGDLSALNSKLRRMRKTFAAFWKWPAEYVPQDFFVSWVRLMTGRMLPLAQRRMFHRECLARFVTGACGRILDSRLTMAGWEVARAMHTSRLHIWPHQALYEDADMAGKLGAKG